MTAAPGCALLAILSLAACRPGSGAVPPPVPARRGAAEGATRSLPTTPVVIGKVELRVVYPPAGAAVPARDSQFIFGSVGSGDAQLTINDAPVRVHPNGAFLAFLPVPRRELPFYELVASRSPDTVRLRHPATPPASPLQLDVGGGPLVDSGSVVPRGIQMRLGDEMVRVGVRAVPDARVWFARGDSVSVELRAGAPGSTRFEAELAARLLDGVGSLVVTRAADTVRLPAPRVGRADSAGRRLVSLGAAAVALPDTDRVVVARPVPAGTYKWFLLPRTVVEVTGRSGDAIRVRLDSGLDVWIDAAETSPLPPGTPMPQRVVGNARVVTGPRREWTDLVLPVAAPPAWSVDLEGRVMVLTLHGAVANTDIVSHASEDPLVERVTWRQELADRARFEVTLREPAFGYLVMWRPGAVVLRVRRAPTVDARRPLAGLRIAVDPGHPPAGTTGPTGLYEAVATLDVSSRLRAHLEARGASVIMTRSGPEPLGLPDRPLAARRADAHAFVSIHLNAPPDGVDPYLIDGTGTYYFTTQSVDLARHVQAGMVRRLGLADRGIHYDNLAVIRPTWMPAVLCEGAFLLIPEVEAALRTSAFQDAYARGVADGLESFFRTVGRRR